MISAATYYEENYSHARGYVRVHLGGVPTEDKNTAVCGVELTPSVRAGKRHFLYEGQEYWEPIEHFKYLNPNNKCKACMDHPDYALGLLGELP